MSHASLLLELRVLAGPQAGARSALPTQAVFMLHVGDAGGLPEPLGTLASDLVLRGAGESAHLRLHVSHTQLKVCLLSGAAELGGLPLVAHIETAWPLRQPLQLGGVSLACGPANEDPWLSEKPTRSEHAPAPEPAPPARRGAERWLAGAGAALALGSVALLGIAQLASPTRADAAATEPSVQLSRALQASEFKTLALQRGPNGRAEITGRLATQAQRVRLDAWLVQQGSSPLVSVRVDEQLSRDVIDVFRLHGVPVQAAAREDGAVHVQASEPDSSRLARAEQAARRDVRGLGVLVINNQARTGTTAHSPLANDPGKRITAVVSDGDLPYLVTADGSRYFVGALLPSGHRVRLIAERQVTIERDGQLTELTL